MAKKQVQEDMIDKLQKLHSTKTRVGLVADRVATLSKAGVHPNTTASQLTHTSPNGHVYTPDFVRQLDALHDDCASRVPLTRAATKALLADQSAHRNTDTDSNTVAQPS